jgi:exopolysaccharide biosynthesis polyprenyl glycosylphosphotransferase
MLGLADAVAAVAGTAAVIGWAGGDALSPGLVLLVVVIIAIHKIAGLYDRDDLVMQRSTLDEMPTLMQVSSIYTLIVAATAGEVFEIRPGPQQLVLLWLVTGLLITLLRVAARSAASALAPAERCLIIGDPEHVRHIEQKIGEGRRRVHVVSTVEVDGGQADFRRAADLRPLLADGDIHRVVIAPLTHDAAETVELVRVAKAAGVRVSILPRVLEAVGSAVEFEQLDGMTILGVRRFGLTRSSHIVKRAFDLVVGGVAFLAALPLLLLISLLVRLDSPGPVFFRQTRVGRDGRCFKIWKFRSMVTEAEAMKEQLRERNESEGLFKITEDPRVTRVGRLLRRTSLDELPQIFNVLTGEMSLVGPRPLVVDEDALIEGIYRSRLQLTPGMTGPWQILGSTRVPLDEMLGIDYLYVANWSLWTDVKILLRTINHVLMRKGV